MGDILITDDEADQASINTKGNRDPALRDGDREDDDIEPSRTNGLIRSILLRNGFHMELDLVVTCRPDLAFSSQIRWRSVRRGLKTKRLTEVKSSQQMHLRPLRLPVWKSGGLEAKTRLV